VNREHGRVGFGRARGWPCAGARIDGGDAVDRLSQLIDERMVRAERLLDGRGGCVGVGVGGDQPDPRPGGNEHGPRGSEALIQRIGERCQTALACGHGR